jgi:hypothetical protein
MPGSDRKRAAIPDGTRPCLVVIVDTEEEFDWRRPLSASNTSVLNIGAQERAQDIFDDQGITPTYVIDYPVATNSRSVDILARLQERGRCEIGAHLHPWVNPPREEQVTPHNSYPGNLNPHLERRKLEALTEAITSNFGTTPRVYKAGRYGIGPATADHLGALGYRVDLSVLPYTSFHRDGGPDFYGYDHHPYWFGPNSDLLEIPVTCGFAGHLSGWGPRVYPAIAGSLGMTARMPGLFRRLGIFERIRLTPEERDLDALRRLTDRMIALGGRVFSFAYHSPSLVPGNTPYVRTEDDLRSFLGRIKDYCRYFLDEVGGISMTPTGVYDLLRPAKGQRDSA